jgi:hypothetical protein
MREREKKIEGERGGESKRKIKERKIEGERKKESVRVN